jgi:hypothetical protein
MSKMNELCRQIQVEKDPQIFSLVVEEFNQLLAKKEERLQRPPSLE